MTSNRSWAFEDFLPGIKEHVGEVCYVALKGSHLYGFEETGSDIDLRLTYIAPTSSLLGLHKPTETIEATYYDVGEKVDLVAHEAGKSMRHLLASNGNDVESFLVPEGFYWADERGEALRRIAPRFLTKRLINFYRGFAHNQLKRGARAATGKSILYSYRELYAGIVLLVQHRIVFPWVELRDEAERILGWSSPMTQRLRLSREPVDNTVFRTAYDEFKYLVARLEDILAESTLPESYDGTEKLDNLLLRWRSAGWK